MNLEYEIYEELEHILGPVMSEDMTMNTCLMDDLDMGAWDISEVLYAFETALHIVLPDYHGREYDDEMWEDVTVADLVNAAAAALREKGIE